MAKFKAVVERKVVVRPTPEVVVGIMDHPVGEPVKSDGWSVATYPAPDPTLVDDRPKEKATERLFWRSDRCLAVAPGHEYAIEDRPLLVTQAELIELANG